MATSSFFNKAHENLRAAELIHRKKIFKRKYASYLPDAQSIRSAADYHDRMVSKKTAIRMTAKAREFFDTIHKEQ